MTASPERSRAHLLSALGCAVAVSIPFFVVTVPPITDLPQQTAQIRLLFETLEGDAAYRVQWLHPNSLGYLPLLLGKWIGGWIGGPLAAGRLGLWLIALAWIVAIHGLARSAKRPASMAAIASLFFFNHTTYWGFLNFAIGLPVFALWLVIVERARKPWLLLGALLLYATHALWLAAGLAWLAVATWREKPPRREILRRFLWISPVLVALVAWYLTFREAGVDLRTFAGRPPWVRLHPTWLLDTVFGGLRGRVEPVAAGAILAWIGLGIWQSFSDGKNLGDKKSLEAKKSQGGLRQAIDGRFLILGGLFFLAALSLPEVHQHTIFFAARFMPMAAVFLVLGAPAPRLAPILRGIVAGLLVLTLTSATAAAWIGFEKDELDGFFESLAHLPAEGRLLGLDFIRKSPRIKGFPYYHLYAWGQVVRGVELNRSFAEEASSLVVFRHLPADDPWTDNLDWKPRQLRLSDRDHFDHILVFGSSEMHARFRADPRLEAVTSDRPWRLYAVHPPAPDAAE